MPDKGNQASSVAALALVLSPTAGLIQVIPKIYTCQELPFLVGSDPAQTSSKTLTDSAAAEKVSTDKRVTLPQERIRCCSANHSSASLLLIAICIY